MFWSKTLQFSLPLTTSQSNELTVAELLDARKSMYFSSPKTVKQNIHNRGKLETFWNHVYIMGCFLLCWFLQCYEFLSPIPPHPLYPTQQTSSTSPLLPCLVTSWKQLNSRLRHRCSFTIIHILNYAISPNYPQWQIWKVLVTFHLPRRVNKRILYTNALTEIPTRHYKDHNSLHAIFIIFHVHCNSM